MYQPLNCSATGIPVLSAATVFKQCLFGVQKFSKIVMATQPPLWLLNLYARQFHDMWPSKMLPDRMQSWTCRQSAKQDLLIAFEQMVIMFVAYKSPPEHFLEGCHRTGLSDAVPASCLWSH